MKLEIDFEGGHREVYAARLEKMSKLVIVQRETGSSFWDRSKALVRFLGGDSVPIEFKLSRLEIESFTYREFDERARRN